MALNKKRAGLIGAAVGTVGAAGVAVAVARKAAVGRVRLTPDPDAREPFGEIRGDPVIVRADDGVGLYVETDGPDDAPVTVVFCHGYCLSQDSWHYQRRDLRNLPGVRLVFWDQRSHGRSDRGPVEHATIGQTGRDLLAVLRATVPVGGRVVLAGHSMGGMTIMALAGQEPRLFAPGSGLVTATAFVNTSSGGLGELSFGLPLLFGKPLRAAMPGVVRGLGKRGRLVERGRSLGGDVAYLFTRRLAFADKHASPAAVDFVERMIRATPIEVIAEFYPALMAHDALAALAALADLPALVVSGDEDRLIPVAHARRIAEAIPGARLMEMERTGHVAMLEHPTPVTAALRNLIEEVPGCGR
jgi:pimeloyl-ACP methyl ester carboxylesterase